MNARPLPTEVIAEAVYSGHYAPDYDMPWEPFPAPDALLTLVERRVPVPTRVTRQTAGEAGLLVVLDANTAFKVDDSTLGEAIGFPPPAAIAPMPVLGIGGSYADRGQADAMEATAPTGVLPIDEPEWVIVEKHGISARVRKGEEMPTVAAILKQPESRCSLSDVRVEDYDPAIHDVCGKFSVGMLVRVPPGGRVLRVRKVVRYLGGSGFFYGVDLLEDRALFFFREDQLVEGE